MIQNRVKRIGICQNAVYDLPLDKMTKHKSGKTIEMNRNTERHSVESKYRIIEMLSLFCDKAYYKHP